MNDTEATLRSQTAGFFLSIVAAWVLAAGFSGCKCNQQTPPAPVEQEKEPEKEKTIPDFPEEVYGDPEIFKKPRFQFIIRDTALGLEQELIGSMALDGTDIRKVVSKDVLYSEIDQLQLNIDHAKPTRSPNNRYIAFLGYKEGEDFVDKFVLIDLKDRNSKIIDSRDEPTGSFIWSSDSRYLYYFDYFANGAMFRYEVATGEKREFSKCKMDRAWLANDGTSFINLAGDAVEIVDPVTCKRKKRTKVPGSYLFKYGTVSLDGSHVFHQTNRRDANNFNKKIWLVTDLRADPPKSSEILLDYSEKEHVFGLTSDIIYSSHIRQFNIISGQTKGIASLPLSSLTIFNTSNHVNGKK